MGKGTGGEGGRGRGWRSGVAGVGGGKGGVTSMMPERERVCRRGASGWRGEKWGEDSPWMGIFRKARKQLG